MKKVKKIIVGVLVFGLGFGVAGVVIPKASSVNAEELGDIATPEVETSNNSENEIKEEEVNNADSSNKETTNEKNETTASVTNSTSNNTTKKTTGTKTSKKNSWADGVPVNIEIVEHDNNSNEESKTHVQHHEYKMGISVEDAYPTVTNFSKNIFGKITVTADGKAATGCSIEWIHGSFNTGANSVTLKATCNEGKVSRDLGFNIKSETTATKKEEKVSAVADSTCKSVEMTKVIVVYGDGSQKTFTKKKSCASSEETSKTVSADALPAGYSLSGNTLRTAVGTVYTA